MEICVLIVTRNRLEKLKTCLKKYDQQTRKPDRILVVDNASEGDTELFLKQWEQTVSPYKKTVMRLNQNLGGSGGFHYGLSKAREVGFDWIWIADDDAYPDENALQFLEESITKTACEALCGSVIDSLGYSLNHRRRLVVRKNLVREVNVSREEYLQESFELDLFSFVGCALSYKAVALCGLPIKDYFIWYDDSEYSFRIHEKFKILCFPKIQIFHDVGLENNRLSWKMYYGYRNQLDMYRRHMSRRQLAMQICFYHLGMAKKFFLDHKHFIILRDAYSDFKKHKLGICDKYLPGTVL